MQDLITVSSTNINDSSVNTVSARELYLGLGLDASHWSRWSKENIEDNEFFVQDVDFIQLAIMASANNPNPPKDFAVTLDFAKHLAMMAKTEKAHEYRNYFLQCEKKVQETLLSPYEGYLKIKSSMDKVEALKVRIATLSKVNPEMKDLIEKCLADDTFKHKVFKGLKTANRIAA